MAVIVWVATDSVVVALLVALPPTRVTGLPKFVPSIWNCTVPVGVPEPGGLAATVAVKVTDWAKTEGLAVEVTVVVVLSWETVWVSVPVLAAKLAIAAVDGRDRVGRHRQRGGGAAGGTAAHQGHGGPKFVPSIWNCTVPVGVPEPGGLAATVAVKVTDWP